MWLKTREHRQLPMSLLVPSLTCLHFVASTVWNIWQDYIVENVDLYYKVSPPTSCQLCNTPGNDFLVTISTFIVNIKMTNLRREQPSDRLLTHIGW